MKPEHIKIFMELLEFLVIHDSDFEILHLYEDVINIEDDFNNFKIRFTRPLKREHDFVLFSTNLYHDDIKGDVEKIKSYLKNHYFKEEK